jgi:hypothetical protein
MSAFEISADGHDTVVRLKGAAGASVMLSILMAAKHQYEPDAKFLLSRSSTSSWTSFPTD